MDKTATHGGRRVNIKDNFRSLAERQAEKERRVGDRRAAPESVNHPAHYGGDTTHEHIKCISAWGLGDSYRLGNASKYLARAGKKSPSIDGTIQDLEKAIWYIQSEIDRLKESKEQNGDNV